MSGARRLAAIFSVTAFIASGPGCTRAFLNPLLATEPLVASPPPIERTIDVNVNYCTEPTQKKSYKTKFIVVFDRSGSNQECTADICGVDIPGTDPDASRRYGGMSNFINTLSTEQQALYSFAFLYFSADPSTYGSTTDPGIATAQMDRGKNRYGRSFMTATEFQAMLKEPSSLDAVNGTPTGEENPFDHATGVPQDGGWTDYLLVLNSAFNVINTDIVANSTPNSQYGYVVIFVSDGAPIVDGRLAPPYVQAGANAPLVYREAWKDPQAPADISRLIQNIMSLNENPGVLGISFNTVYYSAPGVPQDSGVGCAASDQNCTPCISGDPSCTPTGLLNTMATNGGGRFLNYTNGGAIDFTQITLPSMNMSYNLVSFFANNKNVVWYNGQLAPDSDGDGLADAQERLLGTSPFAYSTKSDGVSDWVANQVCGATPGCDIDALIAAKCVPPNIVKNLDGTWPDTDGDGLNDCEETLLGSSPTDFDSNGDFVPDGLAALRGILFRPGDPPCSSLDSDFDGVNDCLEVKLNTPPHVPNSSIPTLTPYTYLVQSTAGASATSGQCYSVKVQGVTVLSNQDQIQFLAVEQPNLFQSQTTLRQAVKTVSGDAVSFSPEDFK